MQRFGNSSRVVRRAVLEQYAEFIAPYPGERVTLAQLVLKQPADLA